MLIRVCPPWNSGELPIYRTFFPDYKSMQQHGLLQSLTLFKRIAH